MIKYGKKTKQWIKDRAALIKEAVIEGRLTVINGQTLGICADCGRYKNLEPDHRKKRSQGGDNSRGNIDWVCHECHMKRDQGGDPNGKKDRFKKADWQRPHACKVCKRITSFLLCNFCQKLSV